MRVIFLSDKSVIYSVGLRIVDDKRGRERVAAVENNIAAPPLLTLESLDG